jgi:WXG100 family type VII secretion target
VSTGSYQKVDWTTLDATISRFNTEKAQIEQTGSALTSEIASLGSNWTGSASAAYEAAFLKWKRGYDESHAVLEQLIVAVRNASDLHQQREGERTTAIQNS